MSNWKEEFVVDLKGNGEGVDYLKIAYVSLSKTVLLISCYSLPALSITPSLLMPLFVMILNQILSGVFIHLTKLQSQQQNAIVSAVLHIPLYLRFRVL